MNNLDQDELDAFLYEVEMVNKQVKDLASGKAEISELDKKIAYREQKKKREEDEAKKKEEEKKIRGTKGKGTSPNYIKFCKFCFTEFQIDIQKCNNCGNPVISRDERMKELKEKVEQYQEDKKMKTIRKAKWDLWIKTQAIKYNKMGTAYRKWELFEDNEDSDKEFPPIVPDTPEVKAMEKDIEERGKRKKEGKIKSNEIKEIGNQRMKDGKYKSAVDKYTKAIELCRDNMLLYTNRALANIKLENWNLAADDCTKVLEYCECFEDGYIKSKDLCYKAFIRRSMAYIAMKKFDEALEDLKNCLNLFPNDKDAEKLKEKCKSDQETEKMANEMLEKEKEESPLSPLILISMKLKIIRESDTTSNVENEFKSINELINGNKEKQLFFIKKEGFKQILRFLLYSIEAVNTLNIITTDSKTCEFIQKEKGFNELIEKIYEFITNTKEKKNQSSRIVISIMESIENGTLNQNIREELAENKNIANILKQGLFSLAEIDISPSMASIFSVLNNLSYSSKFRAIIKKDTKDIWISISKIYDKYYDKKDYLTMISMILGLISNLCIDSDIRELFSLNTSELCSKISSSVSNLIINKPVAWEIILESVLAILNNASVSDKSHPILIQSKLPLSFAILLSNISKEKTTIINRVFMICDKLSKNGEFILQLFNSKMLLDSILETLLDIKSPQFDSSIRITLRLMELSEFDETISKMDQQIKEILTSISEVIKDDLNLKNDIKFSNTCTLMSKIIKKWPSFISSINSIIPNLIIAIKDHIGVIRKSSAILLASMAKTEEQKELIRQYHGMDVLSSVYQYL